MLQNHIHFDNKTKLHNMTHQHLHSPTKLTEFARDFDTEEPDTLFGKLVNRLTNAYNTSYNTINVANTSQFVLHAPELLVPRSADAVPSPNTSVTTDFAVLSSSNNSNNNQRSTPIGESSSSSSNLSLSIQPVLIDRAAVEPEDFEEASLASARSVSNNNKSSTPSSGSHDDLSADKRSTDNNLLQAPNRLQNSVISRISSLMAMKHDTLTSYKDTELQRFWMPDAKSKECYECTLKFTTFRRKHHCRLCGQIFCSKCCNQVVPGKIISCSDDLKVCTYCSKFVLSYLKSADINSDLRSDLQALQNDLTTKLSIHNDADPNNVIASPSGDSILSIGSSGRDGIGTSTGGSSSGISRNVIATSASESIRDPIANTNRLTRRKISTGYQEERLVSMQPHQFGSGAVSTAERKRMLQESASLKALHEQLTKVMPYATATGLELIQYVVVSTQMAASEMQAVDILNAMLQAGFLVPHQMLGQTSSPVSLSTATATATVATSSEDDDELMMLLEFNERRTYTVLCIEDILQMHATDSDGASKIATAHLRRTSLVTHCEEDVCIDGDGVRVELSAQDISQGFSSFKDLEMHNSVISTAGLNPLMEAFCEHEELLLNQLLATESISNAWAKPLLQLCAKIVNEFNPNQCGMTVLDQPRRSMDIRHFVNVKKVPGGQRQQSRSCGGIGFTNNVVHKEMAALIEKPRVLLLRCAIAYQRDEGRYVSIETLRMQETEHLRNVTARILQLQPQVVLVHRNVAGIAQDMLRASGITLVLDVKMSVLERLARTLQCDIVESIDSNVGRPKLGTCDRFRTETFEDEATGAGKTLMFFEQQSLRRGCCVLLRGTEAELVRVKRVARTLLYTRYNWRLELALLLNEFARPPSPRAGIFDSKDHSPVKDADEVAPEEQTDKIAIGDSECNDEQRQKRPQTQRPIVVRNLSDTTLVQLEHQHTDAPTTAVAVVTKQNVQDFSDPLRSAIDRSPGPFDQESSVEFAVETPCDNRFRTALSSTVLSVSPFVTFPLPYLETESGRKCALRRRFPQQLYYSKQWSNSAEKLSTQTSVGNADNTLDKSSYATIATDSNVCEPHEFLTLKMTTSISSRDIQAKWASFRANGGRLPAVRKISSSATETDECLHIQAAAASMAPRIDALDIDNHQRLPVLFLSFYFSSKPASAYCTPPSLLRMTFYGEQDIMLGQFLEHYCFRRSYMCKSCSLPMLSHVRRFVHSLGCVQVKLSEDHSSGTANENIVMTSWCGICHAMTPSVPISNDTWCLSFAKYLEQRFHGHAYRRRSTIDAASTTGDSRSSATDTCTHSMHRDHVHYFSLNGIVASFAYTPIQCWSLGLPAAQRSLQPFLSATTSLVSYLQEIKQFNQAGNEVFARINERLATVSGDGELPLLPGLKQTLMRDQLDFRDRIAKVQTVADSCGGSGVWDVQDAMWEVKRLLAQKIEHWTQRLNEATAAAAAVVCTTSSSSGSHSQRASRSDSTTIIDAGQICTEDLGNESVVRGSDVPISAKLAQSPTMQAATSVHDIEALDSEPSSTMDALAAVPPLTSDKKSVKTILRELLPSSVEPVVCCIPSPLPNSEHYLLSTGGKFPVTVHDQDLSSVISFTLISHDYKRKLDARMQQQLNAVAAAAATATSSQQVAASTTSTTSSSTSIAGAAADASPASNTSNYATTTSTTNSSPSILANSRKANEGSLDGDVVFEQRADLSEKKKSLSATAHIEVQFSDSTTTFICKTYFAREFDNLRASLVSSSSVNTTTNSFTNLSPNKEAKDSQNDKSHHTTPQHSVRNVPLTSVTLSSTDHAEEARALFARSLRRSAQWEARGGKSGSKFCKTMDDRFVLKEMSRLDVTIFENFAPKYFEYIAQGLQRDEPTLLAKIFGVFHVIIRGKERKKDSPDIEKSLLVMENLFYNSAITNKYDLKGSARNRLVTTSVFGGEHVLLDENLIQQSWSQPLYILGHSQSVLLEALMRDASFLERNEVMDYSLLVGLNSDDKILVLGIIDYIRTFTLDKRIESYLKKSVILGGQGKLPTVISPKLYKQRFLEAMERYFLVVPDRWEGLEQLSVYKS